MQRTTLEYEIIQKNPISFNQIKEALKNIESDFDKNQVEEYEKQRKAWLKNHNFDNENNDLIEI